MNLRSTTLTVEDDPPISNPTLAQLHKAIDRLTPSGPSFVIVDGEGNRGASGGEIVEL